jgi:DNA-binding GntR family transcriptional regulator
MDSQTTPAVKTVNQVVAELRDRIVREVYGPGARLKERELAEEFFVSRAVIRDALAILAERSLIIRHANRGAEVASIGPEEIKQIYEAREAIEGLIARLAAERAPGGAWDQLRIDFGDAVGAAVAAGSLDVYAMHLDRFQAAMIAHANNPVLTELTNSLADRIAVLARRSIFLPGRAEEGLRLHREVLRALAERRGEDAERLKRQNLRNAREGLLRYATYVR